MSEQLLDKAIWEKKYFDGGWKDAPATIPVREPATGESLGTAGAGTPELAVKLTEQAAAAQPEWAAKPAEERARIMREAARIIESNSKEIMDFIVRETGGVGPKAGYEVAIATGELYHSAAILIQPIGEILPPTSPDRMSMAIRVPVGVVSVITPWECTSGIGDAIRSAGAGAGQRRGAEAGPPDSGDRRLSAGADIRVSGAACGSFQRGSGWS
jgi:benzaldehyde dehydrogenase (NAD)